MQNIYKTYEVDNKLSENYKGSGLERADKEGWKVTVLKPQSRTSEQYEREAFYQRYYWLFSKPNLELVFSEDSDGYGLREKFMENIADPNQVDIESKLDFEMMVDKLPDKIKKIANLIYEGYGYKDIAIKLGTTENSIKQTLKRFRDKNGTI